MFTPDMVKQQFEVFKAANNLVGYEDAVLLTAQLPEGDFSFIEVKVMGILPQGCWYLITKEYLNQTPEDWLRMSNPLSLDLKEDGYV